MKTTIRLAMAAMLVMPTSLPALAWAATPCPLQNQVLLKNAVVSGEERHLARKAILAGSDYILAATGDLTLLAGESITLGPGFQVESGGLLAAGIQAGLRLSCSTLQIQFMGDEIDLDVESDVFDIDLFDRDTETVAALHQRGRQVLCYLNAGAWEDWRPDQDDFPQVVLGDDYEGWPGEKWLDIRRIDLLAPIMLARLDLCRDKGFEGVDADNLNGYQNDTGLPLTAGDQLAYNRWLATAAHTRGLLIGLKNDTEQAVELEPYFDFAVTESCLAEGWCEETAPFLDVAKPVFAIEYTDVVSGNEFQQQLCPEAAQSGISAVLKERLLDAWRLGCP